MPLDIENHILRRVTAESSAADITVPEGVKTIGYRAFADCPHLLALSLPISLRAIEDHALDACTRLESLTIPQRVSMIGTNAFSRNTALSFRTNSVSLLVPPRTAYYDSSDASVLADILHKKNIHETAMLFPMLKTFEFRAAAAVWLMQEQKPQCAAKWLSQNAAAVMEMYLQRGSTGMLHLMLQTDAVPADMLENIISLAIEKGDHEIYMMLVNHKQEAFGITAEASGIMRL